MPSCRCASRRWRMSFEDCAASCLRCVPRKGMIRTANRRRRIIDRHSFVSVPRKRVSTMADSLRDQLLKSGIVKQVREEKRPPAPQGGKPFAQRHGGSPSKGGKPGQYKPPGKPSAGKGGGKSQDEIDLAKAYAIRAQT